MWFNWLMWIWACCLWLICWVTWSPMWPMTAAARPRQLHPLSPQLSRQLSRQLGRQLIRQRSLPLRHPPTGHPPMSHPPISHPPISHPPFSLLPISLLPMSHPPTARRRPVPTTAIADTAASGAPVPATCATRTAVVPSSTSPKSASVHRHHYRNRENHRNHWLHRYSILLCVALPAALPLGIYLFCLLSKHSKVV